MRSLVALFLALTVGCTGSPSSNGPKGQADAGETSVADTKPTATDAGAATVTDAEPSAAAVCEAISLATRDGDGPASLLDKPSLQTGPIDKAISGSGPGGGHRVAQVSLAGKQLLVVAFDVVALDDQWGNPWKVPVVLLAPLPAGLLRTDAAVLSSNFSLSQAVSKTAKDPVWGANHPAWFLGGTKHSNREDLEKWFAADQFAQTFARNFVVDKGMAVVITSVVPKKINLGASPVGKLLNETMKANKETCDDDFCAGSLDAHHLTNCLLRAALLEDDLTYDPYIRYALTAMRVLDGAEYVLNKVYAARNSQVMVSLKSVFALGCSKYGHTLRTLAAVDPRLAGILVGCADISNNPAFFAQQDLLWKDSFSFVGTRQIHEAAPAKVMARWRATFDQARWKPSVLANKAMVLATGTGDQLYPLPASYTYAQAMPPNHSYLFVPNFGHGIGSIDHIAALRSMVTRTLAGKSLLRVEARWPLGTLEVDAGLEGGVATSAELWCSTKMVASKATVPNVCGDRPPMKATLSTDMRHAWFDKTDMVKGADGRWRGTVPKTDYAAPACLVRMRTAADDVATSEPLLSAQLCKAAGLSK